MRNLRRLRPSPAMVVALIALFVAIGGVSWAAATIGTNDIKDGAVTTDKIRNKAVTRQKLDADSVNSNKIKANAVKTEEIADQAVSTDKIADQAVTTGKIADQAVSTDKIADQAVSTDKIADQAVTNGKLGSDSVSSDKIANGQVRGPDLGAINVRTASVVIPPSGSEFTSVNCAAGEQVIGAGTGWGSTGANRYTNYIHITSNGAIGRGNQFTGSNQTFIVEAYCLAAP